MVTPGTGFVCSFFISVVTRLAHLLAWPGAAICGRQIVLTGVCIGATSGRLLKLETIIFSSH
jgi:hypothetical protein